MQLINQRLAAALFVVSMRDLLFIKSTCISHSTHIVATYIDYAYM